MKLTIAKKDDWLEIPAFLRAGYKPPSIWAQYQQTDIFIAKTGKNHDRRNPYRRASGRAT